METIEFTSKKDWWLVAIVFVALVGVPILVIGGAVLAGDPAGIVIAVASSLVAPAIVFGLAWPIRYLVTGTEIVVRAGPFLKWRVPLAQIERIEPTHNPLSSPTWSIDRVRIDYSKGKWIMISPEPRERFWEVMRERVPSPTGPLSRLRGRGGDDDSRLPE